MMQLCIYRCVYTYIGCFLRSEIVLNRRVDRRNLRLCLFEVMTTRDIRNTRVGKWSLIFQMCGSFDVAILVIKDY